MREAGIKAMREESVGLGIKRSGDEDEGDVDVDQLLEEGGNNDRYARAAHAAQEQAHLGVGAMARAAYNEIDGRGGLNNNNNRIQQQQQQPRRGIIQRVLGRRR